MQAAEDRPLNPLAPDPAALKVLGEIELRDVDARRDERLAQLDAGWGAPSMYTSYVRPYVDLLRATGDTHYFPALALPLGTDDELVCPGVHVEALREAIRTAGAAIDLIIIGYSGLDRRLVELFADCDHPVRSMVVVDRDPAGAHAVIDRLREPWSLGESYVHAFLGDFAAFVRRRPEALVWPSR